MKKLTLIKSIFTLVIIGFLYLSTTSSMSGITGLSTSGCSCHGPNSSVTGILLTGMPTNGYTAGTTYPLTLSVINGAMSGAGFDMTVTTGTLTAGPGTALSGTTELKHTTPKAMVSGTTTWTFSWTAPASSSIVTFRVAGNAVNMNSQTSSDQPNIAAFTHSAAVVVSAPVITAVSSSAVTTNSASVAATVNPNGASTSVQVQYGLTTAYGTSVATSPASVTTTGSVSKALTGLQPNKTYHYRFVATNSAGPTNSADYTFTTLPVTYPLVTSNAATTITSNSMLLNGLVNPQNYSSCVPSFIWGLSSTTLTNTAAAMPSPITGGTANAVTSTISGLQPNTTYYYQLKAVFSDTILYGTVMSAKTDFASSISVEEKAKIVKILPNPTQGELMIEMQNAEKINQVSIFNSVGSLVKSVKNIYSDKTNINLQDLPFGIYHINIVTPTKNITTQILKN